MGVQRMVPEQKKALPSSQDNPQQEDAKRAVVQLIKNTAKDGTVHRFQSQAEVIVMVLTLTVHQHAVEVYRDLDLLANNCAGKLIGPRPGAGTAATLNDRWSPLHSAILNSATAAGKRVSATRQQVESLGHSAEKYFNILYGPSPCQHTI